MSIEIRLLNTSEYETANAFYNRTRHIDRAAPLKPRTYPEFCWEFIDIPTGKAIYAGAWENEHGKEPVLVGIQSVILVKMIAEDGSRFLSAKGEDTLIDIKTLIKYKKMDILKELLNILIQECHKNGVEFLWGFNNIPASYRRLGFETPYKSHHGILVLNPFLAFKKISSLKLNNNPVANVKTLLYSGLAYIVSMKKLFIFSERNNYHFNCELNDNTTLFKNAVFPDKFVFLIQDDDYLNWKISKNPYDITYRTFQLLDENKHLVAQVICSVQKDTAFIVQTLFDKKINRKARLYLLKKIITVLQKESVCMVRYTGFTSNKLNSNEMELLKGLGFIFTGKGEWFTFKKLLANSSITPENIYLSRMFKQGVN